MATERKYGWKKDEYDSRDYIFKASLPLIGDYYPVDLRSECPPVLDQKHLASCTAFATTAMVQFVRNKQKLEGWQPSPLFTYYTTRQIENTTSTDGGAQVRNALKATAEYGVVQENLWAYDTNKVFVCPDYKVYTEGYKHQTLEYHRIVCSTNPMRHCLYEGYPFAFGLMLYESFNSEETIKTGIVKTPNFQTENILGGHCMLCVGWKVIGNETYFIVQNSWGNIWGDSGYCYIPAYYLSNRNNAFDFWTIRLEESDEPPVVVPVVEPPVVTPVVTPVVEPPVVTPVITPVVTPVVVTPVVVTPVTEKKKSILDKVKDILSKIVQYVKRLF